MNALTLPSRAAILTGLIPLMLLSCTTPSDSAQDADPNNAAFVTLLGNDTLAVEQFVRTPTRMEADVVLRTPNTTVHQYVLEMDETGALQRFEATVRAPSEPADAPPVRHEVGTLVGDSLIVVATEGDETQTRAIAAHSGMLPFLDMMHWPFELMLTRAYASGADSVTQDLFTGRGSMPFVVRRIADNAMTAQHPFRGTMDVRVDDSGRLLHLDAGATTRKLIVERVPSVDIEALAESFAARDQEGRSFGALSGRGEVNTTVHGAAIQATTAHRRSGAGNSSARWCPTARSGGPAPTGPRTLPPTGTSLSVTSKCLPANTPSTPFPPKKAACCSSTRRRARAARPTTQPGPGPRRPDQDHPRRIG